MTITKAVRLLKQWYVYAKQQDWVEDLVAWALYKTWKEAEKSRQTLQKRT